MRVEKFTRVAGLLILTCTETKNMLASINKEVCKYPTFSLLTMAYMSAKIITGYIEESFGKTCGDL